MGEGAGPCGSQTRTQELKEKMAKKLEVIISADSTKAMKGMQGFSDSLDRMVKDVNAASSSAGQALDAMNMDPDAENAAERFAEAQSIAAKATDDLLERLDKERAILTQNGETVRNLEKVYRNLEKTRNRLQMLSEDQDIPALAGISERMEAARTDIESRSPAPNAMSAGQASLAYYDMVGDSLGKAREQLSQYEKALRSVITTQGKDSDEAQKLAEKYRKQKTAVDALEKSTRKASSSISDMIKGFVSAQAIIGAVRSGFRLLVRSAEEWSRAAASAEETANLFNTTFSSVSTAANNVANDMASSLGMARSTMQESLGMFGDLAMGYGQSQAAALEFAQAAVQTTLDIISFKNITGDTTEVMSAFASALVGNYENLRRYGYIITAAEVQTRLQKKGLDKLSGAALQFAKVQETLQMVQEKAVNAQGDMVKTLDSTENVARRVTEANKALMENLGRSVNTILTPLRKLWLDIADSINKAKSAQDQFAEGQKNINVYDLDGGGLDATMFQLAMERFQDEFSARGYRQIGTPYNGGVRTVADESGRLALQDDLEKMVIEFGAELDDVTRVLGEDVDPALMAMVKAVFEVVDKAREQERASEEAAKALESMKSNAIGFVDSIASIAGVSLDVDHGANIAQIASSGPYAQKAVDLTNAQAIQEAISDIENGSWKDFFSQIELAFDEVDELDGLESKAESFVALYEAVYNAIATGDVKLKDSEAVLDSIVGKWKDVIEQVKALEAESERVKKAFDLTEDAEETNAGILTDIRQFGMTDAEKELDDIEAQRNLALTYARTAEEIEMVNAAFDNLRSSTIALQKLQAEQERKEGYDEQRSDIADEITALYHSIADIDLNARDAANAEIMRQRASVLGSGDYTPEEREKLDSQFNLWLEANEKYYDKLNEGLVEDFKASLSPTPQTSYAYAGFTGDTAAQKAYNKAMQEGMSGWADLKKLMEENGASVEDITAAYDEVRPLIENAAVQAGTQAGQEARDEAWGSIADSSLAALGDVGTIVSAFGDSASSALGPWGALLNMLIRLTAQTEAVQKVVSLISDSVTPMLDSFLRPLVPFIEQLTSLLQGLVFDVLNPFYEIMLLIGDVLSTALEVVQPVFDVISTLSELLGNTLYPIIAAIHDMLSLLMSILTPIFELLNAALVPVLNALTPVIELLTKAFVTVYAVVKVVVGFISDSFKWLLGNIVTFFTNIINGVIGALQSVNIFGWKPFGGMKKIGDSKFQDMADTDVFGNVQRNWDSAFSLLDDINRNTMETAENTSQQPDLRDLEKVYERGLISAGEFEGLVAEKLGKEYRRSDDILAYSGQYVERQNRNTSISYGNVTIEINGFNGDARSLAKEIKRILDRDNANPTFDMVV